MWKLPKGGGCGFFSGFRVIMNKCWIDKYGLKSAPLIEKSTFNATTYNGLLRDISDMQGFPIEIGKNGRGVQHQRLRS